MTNNKLTVFIPVLTIAIGLGWLLTVQGVMPGVNWIWLLGLGVIGCLTLLLAGIDKLTVVIGPFLVAATFFSLLRQTGQLSLDVEVPALVITGGVLMLASRFLPVRRPEWLLKEFDEPLQPPAPAKAPIKQS